MNWPPKSRPVKRNGCFEGCVLLVVGAIAAAIAIPSLMTIKRSPLEDTLRGHLANSYKECAYHLARFKEDLPVRDLALTKWANKSNRWWEDESGRWKVFDLKTRSRLDLNAGCTASKVLAKPLAAHYGELAYSIDLGNGDKSCITRTGEARDDWSCE